MCLAWNIRKCLESTSECDASCLVPPIARCIILIVLSNIQFPWEYRSVHALGGFIVAAVDATRCHIERPAGSANFAKGYWSSKDHFYALKYEVGVSLGSHNRIVHVSKAYRGAFADINISRNELLPKTPANERFLMDKGYQDDNEPRFLSPVKEVDGRVFSQAELEYSKEINA